MTLVVGDAVVAAVAARVGADVPGVARLHEAPWRAVPLRRGRGRGVTVDRGAGQVVVGLRLVVDREHAVIDVVRTVQRSVAAELRRLAGLVPEVSVTVVDLD